MLPVNLSTIYTRNITPGNNGELTDSLLDLQNDDIEEALTEMEVICLPRMTVFGFSVHPHPPTRPPTPTGGGGL